MQDINQLLPGEYELLREAKDKQNLFQSIAYIDYKEPVFGYELKNLTLQTYIHLTLLGSPFLVGGSLNFFRAAEFIFLNKENFKQGLWFKLKFKLFEKRLKKKIYKYKAASSFRLLFKSMRFKRLCLAVSNKRLIDAVSKNLDKLYGEISEYLERQFFDAQMAPPSSSGGKAESVDSFSQYNYASFLICDCSRYLNYTRQEIMTTPLPELFQLLKLSRHKEGFDLYLEGKLKNKPVDQQPIYTTRIEADYTNLRRALIKNKVTIEDIEKAWEKGLYPPSLIN